MGIIVIDSDYSSALTLLLRYPMPQAPYGPTTFVGDALYLKDHLSLEGGDHIITKYSGRASKKTMDQGRATSPSKLRFSRKGNSLKSTENDINASTSPILSPAKFLRDQGGIDGILQEAAKGVYNKGERWGVAQVLRGAVQGIRSGNSSPQRLPDNARWSLDHGRSILANTDQLTARIKALEERNKALGKMLENVIEDLWIQQKKFDTEKAETAADALSLAIAKTQFVQVYLEDSSIPLVPETPAEVAAEEVDAAITPPLLKIEAAPIPEAVKHTSNVPGNITQSSNPTSLPIARPAVMEDLNISKPPSVAKVSNASSPEVDSPTVIPSASPIRKTSQNSNVSSPFHHPRPSLAQSSFSWMLGEDKRKSSFVSASKLPSEKRRDSAARGKVGFLFGDEKADSTASSTAKGKGERDEDNGFTLGTLKGIPKGL